MLRCPRYACSARVSCPLFASAYPQACRSMWGCALKANFTSAPARSTMRANPAGLNGAPRSDVKQRVTLAPARAEAAAAPAVRPRGSDGCSGCPASPGVRQTLCANGTAKASSWRGSGLLGFNGTRRVAGFYSGVSFFFFWRQVSRPARLRLC